MSAYKLNSGASNYRVVAEIYLPTNIDTENIWQLVIEAAQVSKYIYLNKPITVLFYNEVRERRFYYKMRLKVSVMDIQFEFAIKRNITEIVMHVLIKEEIIKPTE